MSLPPPDLLLHTIDGPARLGPVGLEPPPGLAVLPEGVASVDAIRCPGWAQQVCEWIDGNSDGSGGVGVRRRRFARGRGSSVRTIRGSVVIVFDRLILQSWSGTATVAGRQGIVISEQDHTQDGGGDAEDELEYVSTAAAARVAAAACIGAAFVHVDVDVVVLLRALPD